MSDKNKFKHFRNIQRIGKFTKETVKKIKHEHKVYGISDKGLDNNDGSSLRTYLEKNFMNLTWEDKYKLAYLIVCAVSHLHEKGIVHGDLHSGNVLIHKNTIELANFKRTKKVSGQQKKFDTVPYTDPKKFTIQQYPLNKKSDVYSIGMILWEISSGKPPFKLETYNDKLSMKISQGYRESIVPDTPADYSNLYSECWNSEPNNRPSMSQVEVNEGKEENGRKQHVLNYINDHKLKSQEIWDWLTNNQLNSNFIYLLGYLYYHGIMTCTNMQKTFELYEKAANLGNNMAQYDLALMYKEGKVVNKNFDKAFELFKKSAEKNLSGINMLGYCYENGIGTDINEQEAFELYEEAANLGNNIAQFNLALMYKEGKYVTKNVDKAFELFKKSAEGDDLNGIFMLGYCYENGIGTNVNLRNAFELYEKAANLGNSIAQYNLALMYEKGKYVAKNFDKAFEFFKKSAERGNLDGMFMLGYCYSNGIGTDINKQKAFKLYEKAANLGDNMAQYNLALMYKEGKYIDKNDEKAFEFFEKSAKGGDLDGIDMLKYCYENGIGTDINIQKAFELHQKAANLGNNIAQYELALLYINGENIEKDYNRAFELSEKSAKGNCLGGITILGYCYENGIGTDINKQKAFVLYEIAFKLNQSAANLGDSVAQYNLGLMYENGDGIKKDLNQAIYWYEKSANQGNQDAQNGLENLFKNFIDKLSIYNFDAVKEQYLLNYINNNKINSQKIYTWLLNNHNRVDSTYLLKHFNFYGIETNITAFYLYQKAANLGNNIAQYNLALMYENGNGIKEDLNKAAYWYEKSASQKNQNAKNKLKSIFFEKVIDELMNLILKETNKGIEEYIKKQHIIDYISSQKIGLQEIYNWLLNNQNKPNSICLFGYFNYHGIQTNVNKQKAFELYQNAAKLESKVAQLYLINMYIYGEGTNKNYNKAFELSKKLTKGYSSSGINMLGYCYENGIGTDINKQKAFELYRKAADLGNNIAQYELALLYINEEDIEKDYKKAFELSEKSAKGNYLGGIMILGYCYENGIGTHINKRKAFELYQRAFKLNQKMANLGNSLAQYNLALMYENGDGIKKDLDLATYWYEKSAERGNQDAQRQYSRILLNNKSIYSS
ncbi:kinase-like domain-containing protein [Rhizophagus clarus]|uniref:Kinase-like domain-containing protein n=1 Tax=Rhizophagus clarus TaxID=94130 RepID=A0A8H3R019_9GLOM|nr:kinase-like domain-containing protein [Rhizophagus clarus]